MQDISEYVEAPNTSISAPLVRSKLSRDASSCVPKSGIHCAHRRIDLHPHITRVDLRSVRWFGCAVARLGIRKPLWQKGLPRFDAPSIDAADKGSGLHFQFEIRVRNGSNETALSRRCTCVAATEKCLQKISEKICEMTPRETQKPDFAAKRVSTTRASRSATLRKLLSVHALHERGGDD